MAVVKVPKASRLVIKVQTGISATGSPVYRMRTFRNVKPGAAEADVFAIGEALASLQRHPVSSVSRVDESDLINQ
ncbi:MAG: DUF1659 domain-containing protein [Negativicutes bacterium]|nr:DUF1659 domain-containing protein [Negativicutes bacterium]